MVTVAAEPEPGAVEAGAAPALAGPAAPITVAAHATATTNLVLRIESPSHRMSATLGEVSRYR
jgi:hypothetical protein